jgi:minor histocompatibility antigen H13
MVTVAKSLDVPIKLMFPRPAPADDPSASSSHAMLGLGDVVLPGIMIGLALRFDLYLFYLRRQKRIPAAIEGESDTVEKAPYHSLAGRWSDHFWTHSLTGRPLWVAATDKDSKPETPFTFPKIYFTASLVGYVLGLLATLGVMMVWNHAQPALLYLVPGVLSSIWLTALVRGELSFMWSYTEEVEDEETSKKSDDAKEAINGKQDKTLPQDMAAKDEKEGTSGQAERVASHRPEREVFSFSIEAPWELKQPRSIHNKSGNEKSAKDSSQTSSEDYTWVPSKTAPNTEPAGKRIKLK